MPVEGWWWWPRADADGELIITGVVGREESSPSAADMPTVSLVTGMMSRSRSLSLSRAAMAISDLMRLVACPCAILRGPRYCSSWAGMQMQCERKRRIRLRTVWRR